MHIYLRVGTEFFYLLTCFIVLIVIFYLGCTDDLGLRAHVRLR